MVVPSLDLIEYILYTSVSCITLLSLLLFVPHTLLSSSDDTPLIFYRYLMIIAGLLLFLYNIIINFNGINFDNLSAIKTLCIFLDWLYILIVVPLIIPFINSIITAARTASQISIFKYRKSNLSLVPQSSDREENIKQINQSKTSKTIKVSSKCTKCSKLFITLITLITWCSAFICQILSWYTNKPFFKKILLNYILITYICYISLFVGISFIVLYRQVNKVHKSFIRIKRKMERKRSSHSDPKQNDNSISNEQQYNNQQIQTQKTAALNHELIRSLAQQKSKFVISEIFIICLVLTTGYSAISTMEQEEPMLNILYSEHPLFHSKWNYLVFMASRMLFTMIMYSWLAITNLYQNIPTDSMGYMFYSHCCCYCKCCKNKENKQREIDKTETDKNDKDLQIVTHNSHKTNIEKKQKDNKFIGRKRVHFQQNNNSLDIDFDPDASEIQFTDITTTGIDTECETQPVPPIIFENEARGSIIIHHNIPDIDDMDKINRNRTNTANHGNQNSDTTILSIKILKSTNNITDDDEDEYHKTDKTETPYSNRTSIASTNFTQYTKGGNMTDPEATQNSKYLHAYNTTMTLQISDMTPGTNGGAIFDELFMEIEEFVLLQIWMMLDVDVIILQYSHHPFPWIQPLKIYIVSDDDEMIMGIKCVVYLFDETRIKRLSQHFDIMNENIEFIFIISSNINNENMTENNDINNNGLNRIIGNDHKWIKDCNQNIQLMVLKLIKKLKIENDELLFVGNKKSIKLIETINVCQAYDIEENIVI